MRKEVLNHITKSVLETLSGKIYVSKNRNDSEHHRELLQILAEECSEVSLNVSKALRFGLEDGYPGQPLTNKELISLEIGDLMAIIDLCKEEGLISGEIIQANIPAKKGRLNIFLQHRRLK